MPDPLVRPRAQFIEATDGDTYYVLVNFLADRKWPWRGAQVCHVRLRDYGAREKADRAATDPKGLGRVTGPEAKKIAADALVAAKEILVEFKGEDNQSREVCLMWIDDISFGEFLAERKAVARTATVGGHS